MQDLFQVITHILNHPYLPLMAIGIAAILLLLINRHQVSIWFKSLRTRYCLKSLGLEQLFNVKCPDGMGHHFTIDRVVLRHDGISLISYKQYPGKIFCSDHIDEWTQMLGLKSYKFKNPLFELDYQIKAVSACIPGISVDGYLFFDHQSEFPKGHPDRVIHPSNIPTSLQQNNRHQVEQPVMSAWKSIRQLLENAGHNS